ATSPQASPPPVAAPAGKPASVPTTPVQATHVEYTTIERPGFVARFSNRGAQLVSFQLTGYKTKDRKSNVELVKSRDMSRTDFPFSIEGRNGALAARLNTALYVVNETQEHGDTVLRFQFVSGDGVAAMKTFRF